MKQYRHRWWICATLVCMIVFVGATGTATYAQDKTLIYYPQTGHFVGGEFRVFFERNGGAATFGYPVTPEFVRQSDGKIVQYFERFRFELGVGANNSPIIELGALGRDYITLKNYQFSPVPPLPDTPTRRYFPETGQLMQGAFKNYWDTHNGGFFFGAPISGEVSELLSDGLQHPAQYFERARLEIHADGVKVGLIGQEAAPCQQKVYRPQHLPPSGPAPEGDDEFCYNTQYIIIGTVFPATGLPGTIFGLQAIHFRPEEEVSLWLNLPDATARHLGYSTDADKDGNILVGFETRADDPLGNWSVVAKGVDSNRYVVAPFQLWR